MEKDNVNKNTEHLQKQLEDRRKSRLHVGNQFSTTVEGYEKRIKDLNEQLDDLEEEVNLSIYLFCSVEVF